MTYQSTLLEDTLDPWLIVEPDRARREAVIRFLMDLCEREGSFEHARRIQGSRLPAFAAMVLELAS